MRGRPPKYFTAAERQEARRKASQKYRAKQVKRLADALERIKKLKAELELLRGLNGTRGSESESGSDIPDSSDESTRIEEKLD
jgi:acyl-CoA reductase-like NAD-dependent aldehyde dehydrogenase